MTEEVTRNYLEITSLQNLKEVKKPSDRYSLNLIEPINFQLNKSHIAGASALAPSTPMLFFETSKMDIAPLSKWMSKFMDVQEVPAKT